MKVFVLTENLQRKLSFVNHAISGRNQLPILSQILIEAKENKLVISPTDLEIGIEVSLQVQIEEEGSTTVPAKLFSELISALPQEKITLKTREGLLEVKSSKTKSTLQTMPKEEFPMLYEELGEEILSLTPDEFKQHVGHVVFAASIETSRPALSGMLLKKTSQNVLFVATDGYRLSLDTKIAETQAETAMIIPARVIREALSLKEDGAISIYVAKKQNQIIFAQKENILVGRLIEAEFPNYEKIIPTDFATKVVFDREQMLKAVKTCAIFARETGNIMKLAITKGKIIVSAKTPSLGENTVEVEAQMTGEENEIAFNGKYLLDILSNMNESDLSFEMSGPLNPGVFRIANSTSFLHLIMPIRI